MKTVADSRLRNLCNQCLRIVEQQVLKRTTPCELLLKNSYLHSECATCNLHDSAIGRCIAPKEKSHPDHSVVSGQTHFSGRTIFHGVEQRDDSASRKINVVQVLAKLIDNVAQTETYISQMWNQVFVLFSGENGQK